MEYNIKTTTAAAAINQPTNNINSIVILEYRFFGHLCAQHFLSIMVAIRIHSFYSKFNHSSSQILFIAILHLCLVVSDF
ncbi:hypothetical protein DERF_003492 [Dermatophagoides farinae]|uniref:Uncharacterized protein n=1 Tax=Dermatophagoides farinae TaxID=6954 RepID=A0A922LAM1_DERFA|nr:hypothetical protein DERF_003492 [Dermatophagoides farinae]